MLVRKTTENSSLGIFESLGYLALIFGADGELE
jgi:hypothetical protein